MPDLGKAIVEHCYLRHVVTEGDAIWEEVKRDKYANHVAEELLLLEVLLEPNSVCDNL